MPNVFSAFERTELVAFLSNNGPTNVKSLARAFSVDQAAMVWRLQAAERRGLIQRTISARGYSTYNRINLKHPTHRQIVALGKRLSALFTIPAPSERVETRRLSWVVKPRAYGVLDVLAEARTSPVRGEILLFLAALGESAPISSLSGALSRVRFSVLTSVNAQESYRI